MRTLMREPVLLQLLLLLLLLQHRREQQQQQQWQQRMGQACAVWSIGEAVSKCRGLLRTCSCVLLPLLQLLLPLLLLLWRQPLGRSRLDRGETGKALGCTCTPAAAE